jgi:methyltransferase
LTVQVVSVGQEVEVQPVSRTDVPLYWGYRVRVEKLSLGKIMRDDSFELKLATARIGDNFVDVAGEISKKWSMSQRVLVAFGAPSRGLHEIAQDEGINLGEISDFVVNTVPNQGTVTVRTEEALLASLAIFNVYFKY